MVSTEIFFVTNRHFQQILCFKHIDLCCIWILISISFVYSWRFFYVQFRIFYHSKNEIFFFFQRESRRNTSDTAVTYTIQFNSNTLKKIAYFLNDSLKNNVKKLLAFYQFPLGQISFFLKSNIDTSVTDFSA